MDSKNRHEKRRTAKIPAHPRGKIYTGSEVGKGDTFQKSKIEEKSELGRDVKKDAQIRKRSIFAPIIDEFMMLIEYLNIMERNCEKPGRQEIMSITELLDIVKRKCEFYLNYQFMKAEEEW